MKSSPILFFALMGAFSLVTMTAQASPRAAEAAGSHYLLAADDLDGWHLGGFYRYADREVDDGARSLKQNKFMMTVGRDVLPWVSVYGYLGSTTIKIDPGFGESDPALEYGGGVWANLLDQDLLNNLAMETRLRLQALLQISAANPELYGKDISYTEVYGALTMSIVNELIGNKNLWPEAIGLFFGPVFDDVNADGIDVTGSTFGLEVGVDLYLSRNTTLSLSYEAYDSDTAMNVAINFRF